MTASPVKLARMAQVTEQVRGNRKAAGVVFTLNGIGGHEKTTTDLMAAKLGAMGFQVHPLHYPVVRWNQTRNRLRQYQTAYSLMCEVAKVAPEGKRHLVAHSHGCLLGARKLELAAGMLFQTVHLFAPAMDRQWHWPGTFKKLWVIHNRNDRALWLARLAPMAHPWGDMGKRGWLPGMPPEEDDRIENVEDATKQYPRSHSHYFKKDHLAKWAALVCRNIMAEA